MSCQVHILDGNYPDIQVAAGLGLGTCIVQETDIVLCQVLQPKCDTALETIKQIEIEFIPFKQFDPNKSEWIQRQESLIDKLSLKAYPRAYELFKEHYNDQEMSERFESTLWIQASQTLKRSNWCNDTVRKIFDYFKSIINDNINEENQKRMNNKDDKEPIDPGSIELNDVLPWLDSICDKWNYSQEQFVKFTQKWYEIHNALCVTDIVWQLCRQQVKINYKKQKKRNNSMEKQISIKTIVFNQRNQNDEYILYECSGKMLHQHLNDNIVYEMNIHHKEIHKESSGEFVPQTQELGMVMLRVQMSNSESILTFVESISHRQACRILSAYLCQEHELQTDTESLQRNQKEFVSRSTMLLNEDYICSLYDMMYPFMNNQSKTIDIDAIDRLTQVEIYNFIVNSLKQQKSDKLMMHKLFTDNNQVSSQLPLLQMISQSDYKCSSKQIQHLKIATLISNNPFNKMMDRLDEEMIKYLYEILIDPEPNNLKLLEYGRVMDEMSIFIAGLKLLQWIQCKICSKWRTVSIKLTEITHDKWKTTKYYRDWICDPLICDRDQQIPNKNTHNNVQILMLRLQKKKLSLEYAIQTQLENTSQKMELRELNHQIYKLMNTYILLSLSNTQINAIKRFAVASWDGFGQNNYDKILEKYLQIQSKLNQLEKQLIQKLMNSFGFAILSGNPTDIDQIHFLSSKQRAIDALCALLIYPMNESLKLKRVFLHPEIFYEGSNEIRLNCKLSNQIISQWIRPTIKIIGNDYSKTEIAKGLEYMIEKKYKLRPNELWFNVFAFKTALYECGFKW